MAEQSGLRMERHDPTWADAKLHAIHAIANAPVRSFPFPHIFVEPIFPADFYARLLRHLPPTECFTRFVDTRRVRATYNPQRLVVLPQPDHLSRLSDPDRAFWEEAFRTVFDRDLSRALFDKFLSVIRSRFARKGQPSLETATAFDLALTRDLEAYELGPHTDTPSKLASLLVYLPADDSRPHLGTSLYLPKDRGFVCEGRQHHPFARFDRVATMPYRPNAIFAFPKTPNSFHGVEPVAAGSGPRDTIQLDLRLMPKAAAAR